MIWTTNTRTSGGRTWTLGTINNKVYQWPYPKLVPYISHIHNPTFQKYTIQVKTETLFLFQLKGVLQPTDEKNA
jgi:hypothetical protein